MAKVVQKSLLENQYQTSEEFLIHTGSRLNGTLPCTVPWYYSWFQTTEYIHPLEASKHLCVAWGPGTFFTINLAQPPNERTARSLCPTNDLCPFHKCLTLGGPLMMKETNALGCQTVVIVETAPKSGSSCTLSYF